MTVNKKMSYLDTLKSLLEQQIKMLRKSDFRAAESIAQETQLLVSQLVDTNMPEKSQFIEKNMQIIKLYKTIELIIDAGKDSISKQLRQVANGRKTLKKYRNNAYISAASFENKE